MKILYPEIEPYYYFYLPVDHNHKIYVELSGNPDGIPVIFLHGGPCSGTKPGHRQYFDPVRYRIILFDQRGCGLSEPFGTIANNTTQALCADMEHIRQQLNIEQWLLFGGSWGATLALFYAQHYPERVSGLILRGVFLGRRQDLQWFIEDGARRIYPEQWQRLINTVPEPYHDNILQGLWQQLAGTDEISKRRVTREWLAWGEQVTLGSQYNGQTGNCPITSKLVKQATMELHYAVNRYFLTENQILQNYGRLSALPIYIIHGRQDLVCPVEAAFALAHVLPHARLTILPEAGHIAQGPDMIDALVSATDHFATAKTCP